MALHDGVLCAHRAYICGYFGTSERYIKFRRFATKGVHSCEHYGSSISGWVFLEMLIRIKCLLFYPICGI